MVGLRRRLQKDNSAEFLPKERKTLLLFKNSCSRSTGFGCDFGLYHYGKYSIIAQRSGLQFCQLRARENDPLPRSEKIGKLRF